MKNALLKCGKNAAWVTKKRWYISYSKSEMQERLSGATGRGLRAASTPVGIRARSTPVGIPRQLSHGPSFLACCILNCEHNVNIIISVIAGDVGSQSMRLFTSPTIDSRKRARSRYRYTTVAPQLRQDLPLHAARAPACLHSAQVMMDIWWTRQCSRLSLRHITVWKRQYFVIRLCLSTTGYGLFVGEVRTMVQLNKVYVPTSDLRKYFALDHDFI